MKEIVNLKTIAERTGYSHKTLMARWPQIIRVRPMQLAPGGKKFWYWEDIVKQFEQVK